MSIVSVKNLKKSYNNLDVLKDVSFDMNKGDITAVLGASGSGKSTLLRCLINLETVDNGSIQIDDDFLVKDGIYSSPGNVKKILSKMGMVFQHFNLFPHMTVRKNLILPAKLANRLSAKEILEKSDYLLNKVGLLDKADCYPESLSGGQKQRIAIIRALMLNPEIMLFDEPTSSLDPEITKEVLHTLKQLAEEHMTMIIVTHEMGFAKEVANKIIFMADGEILETGTPDTIFNNPRNERIKIFLNNTLK